MGEVVDRQHGRNLATEKRRRQRRVPVVEVHEVGLHRSAQRCDGGRERGEAGVVVGPAFALLVDVGVGTHDAGHVDDREHPGVGMTADPGRGRGSPVGHVEPDVLLVIEGVGRVAGDRRDHVDALLGQRRGKAGGGFAETAGADERPQFGGGEEHPHDDPGMISSRSSSTSDQAPTFQSSLVSTVSPIAVGSEVSTTTRHRLPPRPTGTVNPIESEPALQSTRKL